MKLVIFRSQSAFLSNRISYALDLKGPSFTMDSACSASMYALLMAVNAMRLNQCDAALVCGTNLLLNPNLSVHLMKLGVLSPEGICRSFDNRASGYARADAIVVIFLQKRKMAKRVYADIVHILGNNDGYKANGINTPSSPLQVELFNSVYREANIDPLSVKYLEAHATGTIVGDSEECVAIDETFCKNRKEPLLVGVVKPNVGHSEASSALCQLAKVIKSFETGIIPATINVDQIRTDVAALSEGRIKICHTHTPLPSPLVAINSFGFGGANAHVLLKQWGKTKDNKQIDRIPYLVHWSGRTENAVSSVIDRVKSTTLDPEFIGLLHSIQKTQIPENLYRGFGVFESTGVDSVPMCLSEENKRIEEGQRPVIWMFSGMGSQWAGMGKSLMQIPAFRESIMKCQNALSEYGVDLVTLITKDDPTIFDVTMNSMIGIASIQIALVDVFRLLEVPVDYIIGHSVGEMACAYADGALTLEQTIRSVYFRGKVSVELKTIDGLMAAIGMGYRNIKDRLPPSIYGACHNSADSCTISGLKADVLKFIEQVKAEGVLAVEVKTSHVAFHSPYIAEWRPRIIEYLRKIMPTQTQRSSKWISSSIPPEKWALDSSKDHTAEYHVNNLLSPVLFEEASAFLPKNAIIVEIGPHALLMSVMRKTFPQAVHVPLTQRNSANSASFLMAAIGK